MTLWELCVLSPSRAPDAVQRPSALRRRAGAHVATLYRVASGSRLCAATPSGVAACPGPARRWRANKKPAVPQDRGLVSCAHQTDENCAR